MRIDFVFVIIIMIDLITGAIIGLHLVTVHVPEDSALQGINPGVYYVHSSGVSGGVYHNSYNRTSVYGGYSFTYALGDDAKLGLLVGAVSGYRGPEAPNWHGAAPLVVPSVAVRAWGTNWVRLAVVPGVGGGCTAVHLSVEHQF